VIPRIATKEEIEAWAQAGAPFYDPTPQIPDSQIPSAGYWSGPVDANERPVTADGAGGRIEIDERGIRAHRYSDNRQVLEFNTNTGDLSIAGDITGSSGTFAEGTVILDDKGITATDPDSGDRSVLDGGSLAFYESGSEDPSWYVRRTAMGVASSGDYIPLGWSLAPSVLVSLRRIVPYRPDRSSEKQHLEVYASNITQKGFQVHCELWSDTGSSTSYGAILSLPVAVTPDLPKEGIYPNNTLANTTRIKVSGSNYHIQRVGARCHGASYINYQIFYKKTTSSTWTKLGDFQTVFNHFNNNYISTKTKTAYIDWEHYISNLDPGTYQIKIVFVSESFGPHTSRSTSSSQNTLRMTGLSCWAQQRLELGDVTYLAMEGG